MAVFSAGFGLSADDWELLRQGLLGTVLLSAAAFLFAACAGALVCALRLMPAAPARRAAQAYIAVFRNTPLLAQLFFWYFGVSGLLPQPARDFLLNPPEAHFGSLSFSLPSYEFIFSFIGLGCCAAAYVAEDLRAGLNAVPDLQRQAAASLGFTPRQAFCRIILPQGLRNSLPALFGQALMTLKNSALASSIGAAELLYAAAQIETETLKAFAAYGAVSLLYIALAAILEAVLALMLKRRANAEKG